MGICDSGKNPITINKDYNKRSNDESYNILFGDTFVENNKDNISLKINDVESELVPKYSLNIGYNKVEMAINNNLINCEYMFKGAISLENIEELKY